MRLRLSPAFLLVLLCSSSSVFADTPRFAAAAEPLETVVVSGTRELCTDALPVRARALGDEADRAGEYQRAGDCYLAAGEKALADKEFLRGLAQTNAETSRSYAASASEVKAQARQLKAAFRR